MKTSESRANPYPGLRPFEFHESHLFFGREGQSEELLKKLTCNRFLAVVGTSGSGKSSLVRAGLLPLLYGGFMAGAGSRWRIALFRPGKEPIYNLAAALNSPPPFEQGYAEVGAAFADEADRVRAASDEKLSDEKRVLQVAVAETTLRRSAVGLVEYAKRAKMREGERLLVIVDQFEELFRFKEKAEGVGAEDEAAAFVKLLLEAVTDESVPVYVVLTMRSDFLGDCSQFRDLPEKINESQYLIPRMTRDQQRDAITRPAAVRGAQMTPQLQHRLLNDVGDNPDQLPILQHALMRTWEFWEKKGSAGEIDIEHYNEIGGMAGALSKHAQEAYDELPDARSRAIAEKIFKALTETVTDGREVRRPTALSELCAITGASEAEVKLVIEAFRQPGRTFLMPPANVPLEPQSLIDISHESLIRNWEQLVEWVKEEAVSARIYRRVAEAAVLHSDDHEGLMTVPALTFAVDWRDAMKPNKAWAMRYHPAFDLALEYLKKSEKKQLEMMDADERRRQEEAAREKRELETAQALAEARRLQAEQAQALAEEQQRRAEDEKRVAEELAAARQRETEIEHRRAEEQARAARRLRYAVAALIVMVLLTGGFAVYAYRQKSVAESQKTFAENQKLVAEQEREHAREAETEAENRSKQLDLAVKAEETAKVKAEHANAEAQKQATAAREARDLAQHAEAEEKKQKNIAEGKARDLEKALDTLKTTVTKNEKNRVGLEAIETKNLVKAETELTALHKLYDGDDKNQAWVEYNLGAIYRMKGDYGHAAEKYEAALTKQEKYDRDSLEVAAILSKLARIYEDQGYFSDALEQYERLLTIQEAHAPSQDVLYDTKTEVAGYHLRQANYIEGMIGDTERVLSELKTRLDRLAAKGQQGEANERETTRQEEQLNKRIQNLNKTRLEEYAKAEAFYNEAVSFREKEHIFDSFSPNHPDLIASYNSLANLYQERNAETEELSQLSQDAQEEIPSDADRLKRIEELIRLMRAGKFTMGRKDAAQAVSLAQIAGAYALLDKHPQAERVYDLVAESLPTTPAAGGSGLADELFRAGDYYRGRNKYETAEAFYLKALPFFEKSLSTEADFKSSGLSQAYNYLAQFYWAQKKYSRAEEYIKKEITRWEEIARANTGNESARKKSVWNMDASIKLLATLYESQDKLSEAEATYKLALTNSETVFGRDHGITADYAEVLGEFYYRQKRYDESLPLLERAHQYFAQKIGPGKRTDEFGEEMFSYGGADDTTSNIPPKVYVRTLFVKASIKSTLGANQEAELLYKEALAVLEWVRKGIYSAASSLWNEDILDRERNSYDIQHASVLEAYAVLLKKTNRVAEAETAEAQAKKLRSKIGDYEEPSPWER